MTYDREKFAEKWLDAALERYGEGEPRAGLEPRILARLDEERAKPARRRWMWAAAAVGAAAVIVITVMTTRTPDRKQPLAHQSPVPNRTIAPAAPSQERSAAVPSRLSSVPVRVAHRVRKAVEPEPKLAQFPAPVPLSEQERLLMQYMQRTPRTEVAIVMQRQEEFRNRIESEPSGTAMEHAMEPERY